MNFALSSQLHTKRVLLKCLFMSVDTVATWRCPCGHYFLFLKWEGRRDSINNYTHSQHWIYSLFTKSNIVGGIWHLFYLCELIKRESFFLPINQSALKRTPFLFLFLITWSLYIITSSEGENMVQFSVKYRPL